MLASYIAQCRVFWSLKNLKWRALDVAGLLGLVLALDWVANRIATALM